MQKFFLYIIPDRKFFLLLLLLSGLSHTCTLPFLAPVSATAGDITASELLERVDRNMLFSNRYAEGKIVIEDREGKREKTFKFWAEGLDKSFMLLLSPPRDRGTKYLKIAKSLKMWLPDAEKIIKISGHMLRQPMLGSDMSYEDFLETSSFKEDYEGIIEERATVDGIECYKVRLTAKKPDLAYPLRIDWIDAKRYVPVKGELYARGGKLLKTIEFSEVKEFSGKFYPAHITMRSMLKKNSKTDFIMTRIEFDAKLPDGIFTERALESDIAR